MTFPFPGGKGKPVHERRGSEIGSVMRAVGKILRNGVAALGFAALAAAVVSPSCRAGAGSDEVASREARASVPVFAPVPPKPPAFRSLDPVFGAVALRKWRKAYALAADTGDPVLTKVVSWIRFTTQGEHMTFGEVAAFIDANPDWPRMHDLRESAEESMTNAVPDDRVIAWFSKHPPLTPKGAMHLAKALTDKGRKAEAEKVVRHAWIHMNFPAAVERTFYRRYHRMLTESDNEQRIDRLLWDGRGWEARRMLRHVNRDYEKLAVARMRLRNYKGGVDWAIRRVPKKYLSNPGLVFERMRWHRRKHRDDEAIKYLRELPKVVPRPDLVWYDQDILARRALRDGKITLAYSLAAKHPKLTGEDFAEAEWLAGFIALRFLEEPKTALGHFTRMFDNVKYPVSRARGAYWIGLAEAALGNKAAAKKWYKKAAQHITTFYGQLAAVRLDGPGGPGRPVPPAPKISDAAAAAFADRELVHAAKLIAGSHDRNDLKAFVRQLVRLAKTPAEYALATRIALNVGRPDVAVWAAKDSLKDGVQLVQAGWPRTPMPKNRHGLEHGILLALMRQESGFNPNAVSWAGARGLMQVMPATARRVAHSLGLHFSRRKLLNDRNYNLTIGSAYFSQLLDRFSGSYVLALAAYNAGPAHVRRWLKRNGDFRKGDINVVDWIELIPIEQTRDYVERVIENVQVYRALFGSGRLRVAMPDNLRD